MLNEDVLTLSKGSFLYDRSNRKVKIIQITETKFVIERYLDEFTNGVLMHSSFDLDQVMKNYTTYKKENDENSRNSTE